MVSASAMSALRNKENLVIGTHNGMFHCDEVLACFMLKIIFPHASIKRTRDLHILKSCDIVLDVGGEYDPSTHRYDHHQKSFQHTMSTLSDQLESSVRLSSAGLIYHHFGKRVLNKLLDSAATLPDDDNFETPLMKYVYRRMYHSFIKEIDGIDNGIQAHDSSTSLLYTVHTDLSSRVRHLYKPWYAADDDTWNEDEHFYKAMELAGGEFASAALRFRDNNFRARSLVEEALRSRFEVHASGEIVELATACPWKEHLFELEQELDVQPEIKYVVFNGGDGSYRVMGVPLHRDSFLGRKFLPETWRGLRDDELSHVAGVDGCIFAHASGFIGGHKTRDGALQMAIKSLHS